MKAAVIEVARVVTNARSGVEYRAKVGAVCPCCGRERIKAYKTMPWSGSIRIRYHKCDNPDCVLCALGETVKSLQEE